MKVPIFILEMLKSGFIRRATPICTQSFTLVRQLAHRASSLSSAKQQPVEQKKPTLEDDIVVDHQEHCKFGRDNDVASMDETAFGRERTRPDEQRLHAEEEGRKVCRKQDIGQRYISDLVYLVRSCHQSARSESSNCGSQQSQ